MQIIALSASANKLSKIQDSAEEYAALIMEELDKDNLGYIEVSKTANQSALGSNHTRPIKLDHPKP